MIASIFLVQHLYSKNLNSQVSILATKAIMPLVDPLLADDMRLHVMNSESETAEKVTFKA